MPFYVVRRVGSRNWRELTASEIAGNGWTRLVRSLKWGHSTSVGLTVIKRLNPIQESEFKKLGHFKAKRR